MGLRVTQVRSAIGVKPVHRGTLRALGLGGVGRVNLLPDRPEIRGMIARVPHLVEVRETDAEPTGRPRPVSRSARRAGRQDEARRPARPDEAPNDREDVG
jgi:large subunit ribosomal protein L30